MGEERHPDGGDRERRGERHANAVAADDVPGCMGADACRERERDEREAGHERARAEDVLEIDRAEEEETEDRARGGEHQEEAAADRAIREPADLSSGMSVLVSRTPKPASPARPASAKPSVCVDVQPALAPWVIA